MNSGSGRHWTPKCAQILGILTAFGFIASMVTTARFSHAALAITKGVGHLPAAEQLLLLDVLLKARNGVDLRDERAFLRCRRREKPAILFGPFKQAFNRTVLDLAEHFARGYQAATRNKLVEALPEGRKAPAVVVAKKGRQRRVVKDVAQCTLLTKYSSSAPTFFGFMSRYSPSCVSSMRFWWYWLKARET